MKLPEIEGNDNAKRKKTNAKTNRKWIENIPKDITTEDVCFTL